MDLIDQEYQNMTPTLIVLLVSTYMLNHISFLSDSLKIWYTKKKSFFSSIQRWETKLCCKLSCDKQ